MRPSIHLTWLLLIHWRTPG